MEVNYQLTDILKEKLDQLSESHKKVARYLTENPQKSAFMTALQIGMAVGVSESTVIRLSYALGFDGFSHLQKSIREQFLKINSSVYKFRESTEIITKEGNIFTDVLAKDIEVLNNLANFIKDNESDLWAIIDAIIASDNLLIIGHRVSYGPAYWLTLMLNLMINKGNLYPSTIDIVSKMANFTQRSVIIAISFPRYTKETIKLAEIGKEKGVKVIGITDNILSPVGRISDLALITETNTLSGADSCTSIGALVNLIITGISHQLQRNIKDKLDLLEEEYDRHQTFQAF